MDIEKREYVLSQSLAYHNGAARTIDIRGDKLISGSIDRRVNYFLRNPTTLKFDIEKEFTFFTDYIFSVRIIDDTRFAVGCKDKNIYICQFDNTTGPIATLLGHTGPVNSLETVDSMILSGSWDTTAKLWSIETGNCLATLEGHAYAVTVFFTSGKFIITGSQDGSLHLWDITGKRLKTVTKAHENIVRGITEIQGIGILTCSNDSKVKLWSLDLDELSMFEDHTSFVFALANIRTDSLDFASGGEDFKLMVYASGKKVQEMAHPNTIWSVVVDRNHDNDLITACGDG